MVQPALQANSGAHALHWCDLPKDLPPYSTVFWHYKQWPSEGIIEEIMVKLHARVREQAKKKLNGQLSLIIIDSQAVKNTCNAGTESKGFCCDKCTNGIKRHLAVDTLGFAFFTHCSTASWSDARGLMEMLLNNLDYFQARAVNLPKITILLDKGYHPDQLQQELEKDAPGIMRKIKFELSPKLSKSVNKEQGESGLVPVQARWVIERTNSWMERCKFLVKNYERNLAHARTKINLCFLRLMLKRLAVERSS